MAKGSGSRYIPEEPNALQESSKLVANGKAPVARALPEDHTFKTFLYNKNEGSVLGRTAKSWVQIIVFYIIFYTLLAGFWVGCLSIFLKTLDDKLPRFYGPGTIIGVHPGVGYQPWLKDDPDSTLIQFSPKDPKSYETYSNALDTYLEKYKNTTDTRVCTGSASNKDIILDGKVNVNATQNDACRFDLSIFEKAGCSKANHYGFKTGEPCIILSLNRLIGWAPEDYTGEVPAVVAGRYKKGSIAFDCEGSYEPDQEYIGERTYIPPAGIDGRFYPYAVMDNYHQPIAMVKFTSLPVNRVVQVQCRAYANNIVQDIESRLGLVTFELLRQDLSQTTTAAPTPAA